MEEVLQPEEDRLLAPKIQIALMKLIVPGTKDQPALLSTPASMTGLVVAALSQSPV